MKTLRTIIVIGIYFDEHVEELATYAEGWNGLPENEDEKTVENIKHSIAETVADVHGKEVVAWRVAYADVPLPALEDVAVTLEALDVDS
jgi:hypothetical protein